MSTEVTLEAAAAATTRKGDTWNESTTELDPWTRRRVRCVGRLRTRNVTPSYHTNTAFTSDGETMVFSSTDEQGRTTLLAAATKDGTLTQLLDWKKGAIGEGGYAVIPGKRQVLYHDLADATLRLLDLDTLEERALATDCHPGYWLCPAPAPGGKVVYLAVLRYTKQGREYNANIFSIDLAGGEQKTVYTEAGAFCGHIGCCPTDADLLLINRTYPPAPDGKWMGSDGKTNRTWTLRVSTGELTELPPRNESKFQVHACWSWDGEHVLQHGGNGKDGGYIGAVNRDGSLYREYNYQHMPGYYGHVGAMAGMNAIILDGNVSPDLLVWLHCDDPEQPHIEVIARHGTDWSSTQQYAHPHPQSDATGRYIAFNAVREGQSGAYLVEV